MSDEYGKSHSRAWKQTESQRCIRNNVFDSNAHRAWYKSYVWKCLFVINFSAPRASHAAFILFRIKRSIHHRADVASEL